MFEYKRSVRYGGRGHMRPRAVIFNYSGTMRPPRVLEASGCFDLSDTTGSSSTPNNTQLQLNWDGRTSRHDLRAHGDIKRNTQVEGGANTNVIKYWNDFAQFKMPQSNVSLLPGVHHGITEFDYYTQGYSFMSNPESQDAFSDYLRRELEACDRPQGVQVLVDLDNGFGGLTEKYLEAFRDEYPSKAVVVWGLGGIQKKIEDKRRSDINLAYATARLSQLASIFIPVSGYEFGGSLASNPVPAASIPSSSSSSSSPSTHFHLDDEYNNENLYHNTGALSMAMSTCLYPIRCTSVAPDEQRTALYSSYVSAGSVRSRVSKASSSPATSSSNPSMHQIPLGALSHSLSPLPSANILFCASMLPTRSLPTSHMLHISGGEKEKQGLLYTRRGMQRVGGLHISGLSSAKKKESKEESVELQPYLYAEEAVFRGLGVPSEMPSGSTLDRRMRSREAQEDKREEWEKAFHHVQQRDSFNHLALSSASPLHLSTAFPSPLLASMKIIPSTSDRKTQSQGSTYDQDRNRNNAKKIAVSGSPGGPTPAVKSTSIVTDLYSHTDMAAKLEAANDVLGSLLRGSMSKQATQFAKDNVADEEWREARETLEGLIRDYKGKNLMNS